MECIRYSKYFLVYHPHLATEVAHHLHERFHDKDEKVRMESVKVVSEAAADSPKAVPQSVSISALSSYNQVLKDCWLDCLSLHLLTKSTKGLGPFPTVLNTAHSSYSQVIQDGWSSPQLLGKRTLIHPINY